MAISKTHHIWTHDDYLGMDDDGKRYEVLDGELIEMPGPSLRHQDIIVKLVRMLSDYVERNDLGTTLVAPTDVVLSPIDIVQPDILFVRKARAGALANGMNVQGAPDLCVEILSPGTRARDLTEKRDRYARFGVREYWIVDPEAETVTVLALDEGAYAPLVEAEGDTLVESVVLPRFIAPATTLFPHA